MSTASFSRGWSKYAALAVLLTPSVAGMAIFVMGPILGSLALSFTNWDMFADIEWVGFANYFKAIGDPAVRTALGNTMLFILGYLPPVVGIGLGVGWSTLIAAELVAASQGLGIMIKTASDFLQTDIVVLGIFVIALVAIGFEWIVRLAEKLLVPWHGKA